MKNNCPKSKCKGGSMSELKEKITEILMIARYGETPTYMSKIEILADQIISLLPQERIVAPISNQLEEKVASKILSLLEPLEEEKVAKVAFMSADEWFESKGTKGDYLGYIIKGIVEKFGRPSIKLPERATCVCEDRLSFDRCTCGAERINDLLDEIRKLNGMDKIAELNNLGGKGE